MRHRPGELCPIAQRAVYEFISGGGRLPRDAEGFVRYAQVVVGLENRRAVAVFQLGFFQYRALKSGRLDRAYLQEILAALPEAAFGGLQLTKPPPGVVSAQHRFARRRLAHLNTWKPTQAELSALRDLVNRKAGRVLM